MGRSTSTNTSNLKTLGRKKKHSIIERISEKLKLIPSLHEDKEIELRKLSAHGTLTNYPPPEEWDDFVDYDPKKLAC